MPRVAWGKLIRSAWVPCRDQLLIVWDSLRFPVVVFFFPARWRSWSWRALHLFGRKSSLYLSCSQLLFIYPCSKTSPWRVPLILGRAGKPWPYFRFVHWLHFAAWNCNVVALYSNKTVLLDINKRYFNPIKSLHWKLLCKIASTCKTWHSIG